MPIVRMRIVTSAGADRGAGFLRRRPVDELRRRAVDGVFDDDLSLVNLKFLA